MSLAVAFSGGGQPAGEALLKSHAVAIPRFEVVAQGDMLVFSRTRFLPRDSPRKK
jgi:hypothetical protein